MRKALVFVVMILSFILASAAFAEDWEKYDKPVPTKIKVRVLSHGAKAMNQHTGAVIVIRDARTGKELDKGPVQGATGDDVALMRAGYPRVHGATGLVKGDKGYIIGDKKADGLTAEFYESKMDAAVFETTVNISKPTQIVVEAYGPMMPKQAMQSAMQSFWLFPGEDITGSGIVLVLRGLIIDVQASLREKEMDYDAAKDGVVVPFFMRMMCGCPIAPAGKFSWEAEEYKITTQAYYKGKLYYEETKTAENYFENVSQFKATVPLPKDLPEGAFSKERIKVRVMAVQPEQNNSGLDEFNIYINRAK